MAPATRPSRDAIPPRTPATPPVPVPPARQRGESFVDTERRALLDTLRGLGPEAPTLCEGWDARDLLAHMVLRESRPDALPGIGMPQGPAGAHTARLQRELAAAEWGTLLARFSRGPARWMPFALPGVGEAVNSAEYLVHHEDLRRAQPGWIPRTDRAVQEAAWSAVRRAGRVLHRRAPGGVVLVAPGFGRKAVKRPGEGRSSVVLTGEPVELLLHAFGRDSVARVEITGDPGEVQAFRSTPRGA
ncbi:TIGR03085 family protein [Kytococcus aerolatus]|uniref:TIGR03085 family protein n=1 Tax=Kytococcus aerolatus TaxID=592308 RepID=A0A212T017_9MICO|nr:TIGR03085 family metal-binding protein [Kytococcus aerolatus]SNC59349.1 TIGR03085 family protein [Kytococcus aerolatus]